MGARPPTLASQNWLPINFGYPAGTDIFKST